MQKATLFIFILVIGATLSTVYAANGFCRRCQEIEEERRKNPPKEYNYYEDYLKENGGREQSIKSSSEEPLCKPNNRTNKGYSPSNR